jgi:hypothetical protein
MTKIVVSFSGGRSSAYMAYRLLQSEPRENLVFVFANTGKETPETLDFVNDCDVRWQLGVHWIEAVVHPEKGDGTTYRHVTYETASRKGEPFHAVIQKYGLPNNNFPHCSRELKEVPIRKFCHDLNEPYRMAIGFRIDERGRMSRKKAEKDHWIFPMIDTFPTTRKMVLDFWKTMPFDLRIQDYEGNCDLCWKKSRAKRLRLLLEKPEIATQWIEWENESEYRFDRLDVPITELIRLANLKDVQLAMDFQERDCSCFA